MSAGWGRPPEEAAVAPDGVPLGLGPPPQEVFAALRGRGPAVLLEGAKGGRWSFVAAEAERLHVVEDAAAAGPEALRPFDEIPAGRRLFGYVSYDVGRLFERLPGRPPRDPAVPDLLLLETSRWLAHDGESGLWFGTGGATLPARSTAAAAKATFRPGAWRPNLDESAFERIVRRAKAYVAAGDIYQVNLSLRLEAEAEGDPFALYRRLSEVNPAPHAAYVEAEAGGRRVALASSSPERLVRVYASGDGASPPAPSWMVETRPIAGTYRRGEDLAALPRDPKERAEHVMLVDLERNDLGRVCLPGTVRVGRLLDVETYSHVHHLVSTVAGVLRPGAGFGEVLRAVFPGGTITGCPKVRAMEIIDELEAVARGPYTGSIGWTDASGDADWSIVIRTVLCAEGRALAQAGAGIVADSLPAREHRECMAKAAALLEAAG